MEGFDSIGETRTVVEDHRLEYDHYRPHSFLRDFTPVECAQEWREERRTRSADKRWTDERGPVTCSEGHARVPR